MAPEPLHREPMEPLEPVDRPAQDDSDTGGRRDRKPQTPQPGRIRIGRWRVDVHRFLSRLLLVAVLVWAAVSMFQQHQVITGLETELQSQQQTLADLELRQALIQSENERLSTDAVIEEIARTRFGYTRTDEILFIITDDESKAGQIISDPNAYGNFVEPLPP